MVIGLSVLRRQLFGMNYLLILIFSDNLNIFRKRLKTFLFQGSHGHGKVMENDWSWKKSWKSHGKLLVMEKSWNSVGHGKSHGKPKFRQIYFVDFVELRALKEFLNFKI